MKPNKDQQKAVTHIYENEGTFLVAPMGSGKTVTALTAIHELLRDEVVTRVLIVSTKRICNEVWPAEPAKWPHLSVQVTACTGTPAQRLNVLQSPEAVVAVNFENLAWLMAQKESKTFDMLVIDESTKMKSNGAATKAVRHKLKQFVVRLAMTGTPVSENLEQLFYQVMLVDGGAAFGKNFTKFKHAYYDQDPYAEYQWEMKQGAEDDMIDKIKHLVVTLPEYSADLPKLTEKVCRVELPPMARLTYDRMEKDMIVDGIVAVNAAVLVNKLQQIACGFAYDENHDVSMFHLEKLSLAESMAGPPTVWIYQFDWEKTMLKEFVNESQDMILHPKSAGHGLDLTSYAQMVFMSPVWSRDLTRQCIARIWRRGQVNPCSVYTLIGADTVEEEIVRREEGKATHHEILMGRLSK
tara:strand:- start:56 stop:1285 length:1230 start_codon:yes stop_codon:yes gene_type:complete